MSDQPPSAPDRRSPIEVIRAQLTCRNIDHSAVSDFDAIHLACAGLEIMPETTDLDGPINARVWLAAALAAHGRYHAPAIDGHPADVGDDGPPIEHREPDSR